MLAIVLSALTVTAPTPAAAQPALPSTAGWPLTGSPRVLRSFRPPDTAWGPGHRGVDLAAQVGAPVLAAAAGRVSYAGALAGRGVLVVDHGTVRTTYEPVSAVVQVGTVVAVGDTIGRLAPGGHCGSIPCLHWGLRRGPTYLDPLALSRSTIAPGDRPVRLLPASARAVAQQRAEERAAVAVAADADQLQLTAPGGGTSGRHAFLRPVPASVTSGFGRRFHPVLHRWKLHDGTDLGAACGTPIRAPAAGVVTRAFLSPAYGRRLFLDHGSVEGRRVVTSYNHASGYLVGVGSRVGRGQLIGYVGATGYATGCHLHLMVWLDGRLTDPMTWF